MDGTSILDSCNILCNRKITFLKRVQLMTDFGHFHTCDHRKQMSGRSPHITRCSGTSERGQQGGMYGREQPGSKQTILLSVCRRMWIRNKRSISRLHKPWRRSLIVS
ncbi:hypothetical protein V6Z11_D11G088200 [Gossypium hirsutum]